MDKNLKQGFKNRNDHILQAAWLSSFSPELNKNCPRDSMLYTYNMRAKKYLITNCANVMLSDYLIENYIDDLYVKSIEDKTSDIIKNNHNHLGEYILNLITIYNKTAAVDKNETNFILKFIGLLDCRSTITLIDNAYKLQMNKELCLKEIYLDSNLKSYIEEKKIMDFDINNHLDLLFLSNCMIKTRYNKLIYNMKQLKSPLIRLVTINNICNEDNTAILPLIGETPVMHIPSMIKDEQEILKQLAAYKSKNNHLIFTYWDKFSKAYLCPLSWEHVMFLHETKDIQDIPLEIYNFLTSILIDLYQTQQVLGSHKDLVINPLVNDNQALKFFIDDIIQKTNSNSDWKYRANLLREFKHSLK